jgi:hypothetical protein
MVSSTFSGPFGAGPQELKELEKQRVAQRHIFNPEMPTGVKTDIVRNKYSISLRRVGSQTAVLAHAIVEDDFENPLVGEVPSGGREHGAGMSSIREAGAETHVGNRRTHVAPGQEGAAIAQDVRIELGGKVVDVNIAAGARVFFCGARGEDGRGERGMNWGGGIIMIGGDRGGGGGNWIRIMGEEEEAGEEEEERQEEEEREEELPCAFACERQRLFHCGVFHFISYASVNL